ncbi:unannotated protein [freshwater metagenome]|uniref:Unannotated protein n=1 Tax=freshwater metagenome TaxID=449393 RepID=A0A6J7HE64_9ZZZZ|nr:L,D-transpeptidase family protein [Actinomycetota bacterium]
MGRRAVLIAVLGLCGLPAAASARPPVRPVLPPTQASIDLRLEGVAAGGVLARTRWVVRGTVTPYVPGQTVTVRLRRSGHKLLIKRLSIERSGTTGTFALEYRTSVAGRIVVSASHRATPEMATAIAAVRRVDVLPRYAVLGTRGPAVRLLRTRLARRGYVVNSSDRFDLRMARAVTAFRKLTGMPRTAVADERVFRRLARGEGGFRVRYPSHGRHVEGDLTHQVLALIDVGRAARLYPMSSGAPATPTILGNFSVYAKTPGTNQKGMIYSSYFIRGFAVHGYIDVPVYPASHGCLRVPPEEAISIYAWIRIGTRVDTYYR